MLPAIAIAVPFCVRYAASDSYCLKQTWRKIYLQNLQFFLLMIGLMNHFKTGWYVVYTRPQHEKKIAQDLNEMQMTYFLPTTKKLSIWCDRRKFIDWPLFPSYVFTYLKNMHDYYDCLNVNGVLNYVRLGKEVVRVQEAVIDNIRLAVNKGSEVEVANESFQPGQQLVINQGPLTGLTGEVVKYNGKEKLLIRLQLLQRNLLVTMSAEHLMPPYVQNNIHNGY